jgi:xylulokinase
LGYGKPTRTVGWHASDWIDALAALTHRLDGADSVDGVVVSGNGPTVVPVTADGRPSYEVLFWLDQREDRLPEEPSFFLPKIAWLARHEPRSYEDTSCFLGCPEYLSYWLTGEAFAATPSDDFTDFVWSERAIAAYGLSPEKFPPYVRTGDRVGVVQPASAERLGVPSGIPVVAGAPDFLMTLLGTGAVRDGRTCDRAGTSEGINYCSSVPVSGERLRCLPHVIEGKYNVAGILSSTGRIFEWFRRISGLVTASYEQMMQAIASCVPASGSPLFLPGVHQGAAWEFGGGVFLGLEEHHGSAEMGRAVVESIGYTVREAVEILQSHGCSVEALRVSGGQAKNATWNQMKADITGVPVLVPVVRDAELLGNVCAAAVAMGSFSSLAEASDTLVRFSETYEPRSRRMELYTAGYERYLAVSRLAEPMLTAYRNSASSTA